MFKWLGISAIIVVLDQITKQIAENSLTLYERVSVMPFFNFTLAYNEGAAFSFLAD
ncbi:MAG: signal peptidase II, partial [Gammaproteobacteria bacterium]|nr:signal peptidase II [Gammaproteobacteria bacterium]